MAKLKFKKDQLLVVTQSLTGGCGERTILAGTIVKVAFHTSDENYSVKVYTHAETRETTEVSILKLRTLKPGSERSYARKRFNASDYYSKATVDTW